MTRNNIRVDNDKLAELLASNQAQLAFLTKLKVYIKTHIEHHSDNPCDPLPIPLHPDASKLLELEPHTTEHQIASMCMYFLDQNINENTK